MHTDVEFITPMLTRELLETLASNSNQIEEVQKKISEESGPETKDDLKKLIDQNSKMKTIISSLVEYWKIESADTSLETTDINEILAIKGAHFDVNVTLMYPAGGAVADFRPGYFIPVIFAGAQDGELIGVDGAQALRATL